MCLLRRFRPHIADNSNGSITVWCQRRHCCCVCACRRRRHDAGIFCASHCCIYGADDTAEARGIGCTAPRDTSCPVAPHASTRFSVLLRQPLSQQQRPLCWSLRLPALRPLVHTWSSKSTMSISDSCLVLLWNTDIIRPINSKPLMDFIPSSFRLWSMASAASISRMRWRIRSTRSEVVGCPLKLGQDDASLCSPAAADRLGDGSYALLILKKLQSNLATLPERLSLNDTATVSKSAARIWIFSWTVYALIPYCSTVLLFCSCNTVLQLQLLFICGSEIFYSLLSYKLHIR